MHDEAPTSEMDVKTEVSKANLKDFVHLNINQIGSCQIFNINAGDSSFAAVLTKMMEK